jgi:hypothetical protein
MTKPRDLATLGGGFTQSGTGAIQRTVENKLKDTVSVKDFGAVGDGTANDTAAIQAAFTASGNVVFPAGTYRMNSGVSLAANNISVDFGNATIVHGGTGTLFNFGTTSDAPIYSGLQITGGTFTQSNPATTNDANYIRIKGTSSFAVRGVTARNVSNGGILVEAGCENGLIEGVNIIGSSGFSTIRGIWLAGSTASDFASQLVDTTSITRNATALPVYAVKKVAVRNCNISGVQYGVYLMNARDCSIEGCNIDISGSSALRCIAVNNYSPNTRVVNNALTSDRSSTGILVTQASDGVVICSNVFEGTFGGNRDIFVQYLAEALIEGNHFLTTGTQNIEISMGGFAMIKGNHFNRGVRVADNRCVYAHPIDGGDAGTTIGNTATVLPGLIFRDNTVRFRCVGVLVDTTSFASVSGNKPAMSVIDVRDNTFMNMDLAASGGEYPLNISSGTSANITRYRYEGNVVLPATAAGRNAVEPSGTAFFNEATQAYIAQFSVSVATAGGAITTTKFSGANFSLAVSRSGNDLILSPRTIGGNAGADVAVPFGFTDLGGTIHRFAVRRSGSNYLVSGFDSAGTQIAFNTTAGSFHVVVGPNTAT